MKQFIFTLVTFASLVGFAAAQNINFDLADPHPDIRPADVGDMEFADVDGDGDNDLIAQGRDGVSKTIIYLNDGTGAFTQSSNTAILGVEAGTIAVNDVDQDGDVDLLITGAFRSAPSTNLYINDGAGIFTPSNVIFIPTTDGDIAFGDIDADGDEDLILSGLSDNNGTLHTTLYLSDGTGNFTEVPSAGFPELACRIEFFDHDGDSDLDVIFSGSSFDNGTESVQLFSNDGQGTFTEVTDAGFTQISDGDVDSGDIDNDGDMDILICGTGVGGIATELYLNDGTGTFTMVQDSFFADVTSGDLSMNDFDNDGDLDVFVLGTGPGGLANNLIVGSVYENLGNATFVKTDSLAGAYLSAHATGDIDGDGDLDLALCGTTIGERNVRDSYLYFNETESVVNTEENSSLLTDHVLVYPNPFINSFQVDLENDGTIDLQVFSAVGKLVYAGSGLTTNTPIPMDLPSGNYVLKVIAKEKSYVRRIVCIR